MSGMLGASRTLAGGCDCWDCRGKHDPVAARRTARTRERRQWHGEVATDDEVTQAMRRQIEKWQETLDWLADHDA